MDIQARLKRASKVAGHSSRAEQAGGRGSVADSRACLVERAGGRGSHRLAEPLAPCQTATATTVGGCTFEEISAGSQKNYACDNLVDIDGEAFPKIKKAARRLISHVKKCLGEIDLQRSPEDKVVKFYIGKASIHRRKKAGRKKAGSVKYVSFDRSDRNTWKKTGISSRWSDHKKKPYGKDGMFVLAAISRKSLPPQCRQTGKSKRHQEDYALAL